MIKQKEGEKEMDATLRIRTAYREEQKEQKSTKSKFK